MSTERLTPTSYLILGLLAREGPSTPYDLEQHVKATLGNFWSFPPPSCTASRPAWGPSAWSRRRVRPRVDVDGSLRSRPRVRPLWAPGSIDRRVRRRSRDPGLLQLFFADMASDEAKRRLAERQLAIHEAKLAAYRDADRHERRADGPQRGQRTVEHWRGETLPMGLRYERRLSISGPTS